MSHQRALPLLCLLLVTACSKPKPPEPPPPPPPAPVTQEPEPPPPPPPPPKCEALSEGCRATADTKVAVGDKGLAFRPPPGWTYAREAARTVAVSASGDAVIALAFADADTPDAALATLATLGASLEVTGVKPAPLKARWKRPDKAVDDGQLKLWEVSKEKQGAAPKRKDKAGTALAVSGVFAGKTVVGLGFVADGAEADAGAILDALGTLKVSP